MSGDEGEKQYKVTAKWRHWLPFIPQVISIVIVARYAIVSQSPLTMIILGIFVSIFNFYQYIRPRRKIESNALRYELGRLDERINHIHTLNKFRDRSLHLSFDLHAVRHMRLYFDVNPKQANEKILEDLATRESEIQHKLKDHQGYIREQEKVIFDHKKRREGLGHVDKCRSHSLMHAISIKPRKLSAVLS